MIQDCYTDGYNAYLDGRGMDENPYDNNTNIAEAMMWINGYYQAEEDD